MPFLPCFVRVFSQLYGSIVKRRHFVFALPSKSSHQSPRGRKNISSLLNKDWTFPWWNGVMKKTSVSAVMVYINSKCVWYAHLFCPVLVPCFMTHLFNSFKINSAVHVHYTGIPIIITTYFLLKVSILAALFTFIAFPLCKALQHDLGWKSCLRIINSNKHYVTMWQRFMTKIDIDII